MCRLYGFRANEPTKVECTLVYAQNALLSQSERDLRGAAHPDGWGIACYENGRPVIERRETPAFSDAQFSWTAERVYAHTVVAHVRAATVGERSLANTHPFSYGAWVFAHNGTMTAFDALRPHLEAECLPWLWQHRRGTTDSETIFYLLLSRIANAGIPLDDALIEVEAVAEVVEAALVDLERRNAEAAPPKPAKLNFLLTNGRCLVATRHRNDLYVVERHGVLDCEICGMSHVEHERGVDYRAVVLASEPLSEEAWMPIREGSVWTVDQHLEVRAWTVHGLHTPV